MSTAAPNGITIAYDDAGSGVASAEFDAALVRFLDREPDHHAPMGGGTT